MYSKFAPELKTIIMNKYFITLTALLSMSITASAQQSKTGTIEIDKSQILVETVLTKEEQEELSPGHVLKSLKAGNDRFVRSQLTARDHSEQVRQSAEAQYPKAFVLSCIDSRVPVEDVFDKGIGDIFVARIAGNFVNDDILGSMEYATKIAGAKLILILGHENCEAIHAAIDGAKLGHITQMLENIKPAINISTVAEGPRSSQNRLLVHEISENNVRIAMEKIAKESPLLLEMVDKGEIDIQGAVYDMDTGVVNFIE
jgi:carbonic anhydrase